jgi:hypothetical protein
VTAFFESTTKARVNMVVLRWFDALPRVEAGEDIDILVADADLEKIAPLLHTWEGDVPVDLYTVSGLPGTQYKHGSYLPAALAEAVLKGRVMKDKLFPHPSAIDHFDSLAYHAVFHKGPRSGLPSQSVARLDEVPEHDYAEELELLRKKLQIDVAITLEGLAEYLTAKGYRPTPAALAKLRQGNTWIEGYYFGAPAEAGR